MVASLIRTDGSGELITPLNETDFTLSEIQKHVGGLIEVLHLSGRLIMIVNEGGKLNGLDINPVATFIAHENMAIHGTDYIVGDAVVCDNSMLK